MSHTFRVLDANDPAELADWLALWQSWPQREIFAHPQYVSLYLEEGQRALCAVGESDSAHVLYPFILRDLTRECYWPAKPVSGFDIISPYGFGGPFAWGLTEEAFSKAFWSAFDRWAAEKPVISEFIRFALFSSEGFGYPGEREEVLKDVVRDLFLTGDALLMDFEHKVRKNIKKAERSGITIEEDASGRRLQEFLGIYKHTMDRREAGRQYYFPRSYFEKIPLELPGQFRYFHALHQGRVVSTELVLVSEENVYSFLGGTVDDAFDWRPNDLLKYEIIKWAQRTGKRRFILGGGYQRDDGIYRYKLSFAPRGVVPFFVGRRVISPDLYEELVRRRSRLHREEGKLWAPSPGFFPAYRS